MKVALLCVVVIACLLADSTGQGSTFEIKCGVEELQEEVIARMDAEDVKLDELQVQHHELQGKLDEVQVQNNELQGKVDEVQVQNSELQGKVDEVQVQNHDLQEKLDEVQVQQHELQGKVDSMEGKLDEVQQQNHDLRGKMDTVEEKMDDLKLLLEKVVTNTAPPAPPQWIIIQRRGQYGNLANFFAKSMADYKTGFGNTTGEFWLGLAELARLTKDGKWEMQVDLVDYAGRTYTGVYHKFRVGAGPRYELEVGEYDSGKSTMGYDVFSVHNKMAFSTKDVDQDTVSHDCSNKYGQGGWWYQDCYDININGENTGNDKNDAKGMRVHWIGKGKQHVMMKETEMKMKKIM